MRKISPLEVPVALEITRSKAWFEIHFYFPHLIIIIDHNGPMTVTNDIENVIADIHDSLKYGGPFKDVCFYLYRDSNGTWDEVIVKGGKFMSFNILDETKLEKAVLQAFGYREDAICCDEHRKIFSKFDVTK